jgi:hypothetical protein
MMILSQYHIFELDTINIYSEFKAGFKFSLLGSSLASDDEGWKEVNVGVGV